MLEALSVSFCLGLWQANENIAEILWKKISTLMEFSQIIMLRLFGFSSTTISLNFYLNICDKIFWTPGSITSTSKDFYFINDLQEIEPAPES